MNTEEIIRNIEPRYTVVKNKDLSKDATVYYHEDDVKKAIAKALTLGNVSQQREQFADLLIWYKYNVGRDNIKNCKELAEEYINL